MKIKMNSEHYKFKQICFKNMADCFSMSVIGKRRSKKTTWAKRIAMEQQENYSRTMVMVGNKDCGVEWRQVVKKIFIVDKSTAQLQRIRDYQDKKCYKYTDRNKPIPLKYKMQIFIDDCGADKKFMNSSIIKDLLSNGRHYGISLIILVQYFNQLPSENRGNMDYICMRYTTNDNHIKKVVEEYLGNMSLRTFKCVLHDLTFVSKNGLLVIDLSDTDEDESKDTIKCKNAIWPIEWEQISNERIDNYSDERTKVIIYDEEVSSELSEGSSDDEYSEPVRSLYTDKKGTISILRE